MKGSGKQKSDKGTYDESDVLTMIKVRVFQSSRKIKFRPMSNYANVLMP